MAKVFFILKLHYVMNFQTWEQISLRTDRKKNMFNQMESENWNWLQFGQILLELSYKTRMSFIPCSLSKVYCVGFLSTTCAGESSFTFKKMSSPYPIKQARGIYFTATSTR